MSTCICKEISCPKCGTVKKTQMWPGISVHLNPELREKVISETLFDWSCPECGYQAQMVYPCLYHDKEQKLLICMAPNDNIEVLKDMEGRYPQMENVKKRVVSDLAELKEKVLIFEAGLDDIAVELVKLAMTEIVHKKYGDETAYGLFSTADKAANHIGFSFFFKEKEEPVYQGTRMDVYQKSLEIAKNLSYNENNSEFLRVNSSLAQELLDEYQNRG